MIPSIDSLLKTKWFIYGILMGIFLSSTFAAYPIRALWNRVEALEFRLEQCDCSKLEDWNKWLEEKN